MIITLIDMICALTFGIMSAVSFKRKEPMVFWTGGPVTKDMVTDVHKYNVANGIMWMLYGLYFLLSGIFNIRSVSAGRVLTLLGVSAGVVAIHLAYWVIKRHFFIEYRNKYISGKLNDYK